MVNMSGSAASSVSVEPINGTVDTGGNSQPILHEVFHGLKRLARTGEGTQIDLSSIPFGPGDEERLLKALEEGEVEANVDALGPTRVRETGVRGVWLVDYRNLEGQRLALHIEITTVPDILRTQPQDIQDAIYKLESLIETDPGDATPKF